MKSSGFRVFNKAVDNTAPAFGIDEQSAKMAPNLQQKIISSQTKQTFAKPPNSNPSFKINNTQFA